MTSRTPNTGHNVFVAFQTGFLRNPEVPARDLNFIREMLGSKRKGVKKTVYSFGCIFR
jgi:hypothetical protein